MNRDGEETRARNNADREAGVAHLRRLQRALARRQLTGDLDTRAIWPRLRIHSPYEANPPSVADFENSVVAARFEDGWWFAWPWAEKITAVTCIRHAVDRIASDLGGPEHKRVAHPSPIHTLGPHPDRLPSTSVTADSTAEEYPQAIADDYPGGTSGTAMATGRRPARRSRSMPPQLPGCEQRSSKLLADPDAAHQARDPRSGEVYRDAADCWASWHSRAWAYSQRTACW